MGEITPDQCKEVMKRLILKKYTSALKTEAFGPAF